MYRIIWSNRFGGTGEMLLDTALMTDVWIDELKDRYGADAFALRRNGVPITLAELGELISQEKARVLASFERNQTP